MNPTPKTNEIAARIKQTRVVAVLTLHRVEDALPVAEALLEGGICAIELTLRTPASEACLRKIADTYPDMLIGAGTVLSADQLHRAEEAGAVFAVSPGLNHVVSQEAAAQDFPYFPGVMTPTDVETALAMGHRLMKFFPAETAGGIKMLHALAAPYAQAGVSFLPLGGVNAANAKQYLDLPVVDAIGGSWIAEQSLIANQQFKIIRERAIACRAILQS